MSPPGIGRGLLVADYSRFSEGCVLQEDRVGRHAEGDGTGAFDGA
jgi:hypothetical protein